MQFSIVIPTYNRADELRATLCSLSKLSSGAAWELLVVDNNSTDATCDVVRRAAEQFPVELRYLLEREQGRSAALNAGIRASRGEVVVTTDDDVRVDPDWLDRAGDALTSLECDYVGGRVLPLWGAPRPEWIPDHGGRQWAVIALLDYGAEPIPFFTRAHHVPLGVNMAFRREAFDRAGLWDNSVGRRKGTLLGQEVREWMGRARAAGLRGSYAPSMVVRHVIQKERLRKQYFRRWYYWNGVSRALLYRHAWIDMQSPESTDVDYSRVPHLFGVPRFYLRKAPRELWRLLLSSWRRDRVSAFDAELWLWFLAGVLRQRWTDRRLPRPPAQERARPLPTLSGAQPAGDTGGPRSS